MGGRRTGGDWRWAARHWLLRLCLVLFVLTGTAFAAEPAPASAPDVERIGTAQTAPIDAPKSFEVRSLGWLKIGYDQRDSARVDALVSDAAVAREWLRAKLKAPVLEQVTVLVARTPRQMATLVPEGARAPDWASGLAFPSQRLILLTVDPPGPPQNHDLRETLRHELAHIALHDAAGGNHVPRWFDEGFAVMASGEGSWKRFETLGVAAAGRRLMPLAQLEHGFPNRADPASVAYAQSADMVRHMVRVSDVERFGRLMESVRKGQTFEQGFEDAYGTTLAMFEVEWRDDVARRFTLWPVLLSGSFIWVGAIGMVVWAWARKRKQANATIARWEREEATELERTLLRERLERAREVAPRLHIVFARPNEEVQEPIAVVDPEVPKVEHEGNWHTLH